MFTSRAEYRIILRQDNADSRLTPMAYNLGLVSEKRYTNLLEKNKTIDKAIQYLEEHSVEPSAINEYLEKIDSSTIKQKTRMNQLVLRPQVYIKELINNCETYKAYFEGNNITIEEQEQIEIRIKYQGYIDKEEEIVKKMSKFEDIKLKDDFDYSQLKSISFEGREKLSKSKPKTLEQASRISGVSPSDIAVLLSYFGKI